MSTAAAPNPSPAEDAAGADRVHAPGRPPALLLTQAGYRARQDELERLKALRRREVSDRLSEAGVPGDVGAADEQLAILEEGAIIDARIARLEDQLRMATIVEDDDGAAPGTVAIGSSVTVEDVASARQARYRIVGSHEATDRGDVSATSPVGQALLGAKVGDAVTAELPGGRERSLLVVAVD